MDDTDDAKAEVILFTFDKSNALLRTGAIGVVDAVDVVRAMDGVGAVEAIGCI
jgi:hypothetical protein